MAVGAADAEAAGAARLARLRFAGAAGFAAGSSAALESLSLSLKSERSASSSPGGEEDTLVAAEAARCNMRALATGRPWQFRCREVL